MNRTIVSFLLAVFLSAVAMAQSSADVQAGGSASQNTSASADKSGAQANSSGSAEATSQAAASGKHGNAQAASASRLQSGSTVQAELSKPVDVRKNKPGDEVIAKTTQDVKSDGKVVLPKGSKIVGKVTQAQERAKGQDESQLGIAFDHAILKDGTQMPVSFAIQAVGSSEAAASAAAADDSAMMAGNAGGMARFRFWRRWLSWRAGGRSRFDSRWRCEHDRQRRRVDFAYRQRGGRKHWHKRSRRADLH